MTEEEEQVDETDMKEKLLQAQMLQTLKTVATDEMESQP